MGHRVASNVIWNWAGLTVTVLTGFVVAPFLVHRLGDTVYGIWILIASMSGYFGLLDLGVHGSVGRYIAYFRARNEQEEVNRSLSTAVTLLTGVAFIALLATFLVLAVFFRLFDVPPENVAATRLAILIIGINLAVTFPIAVFDGVLWGMERFDLMNAVEIPTVIARTVLTFWLVQSSNDILTLAWITLGATAIAQGTKLVLSFRVDPQLRVSFSRFSKKHAGLLFGYGLWQFLLQVARQAGMQIGPLIIGVLVSVAAVTPYSIAMRLITYAGQFMISATGVLTPFATKLHARQDGSAERRLFIEGGRWCTAVALGVGIGIAALGGPLLKLWMGAEIAASAAPVLLILIAGEVLAMSQWLTFSITLGKARHRALALASLSEGVIAALGGALAAKYYGVIGVSVVFAAAAFCCRGVFQVVYGSRMLEVPLRTYIGRAILVPALVAAIPAAILGLVLTLNTPDTWVEFFATGGAYGVLYGGLALVMLGGLKYIPLLRGTARPAAQVEFEAIGAEAGNG